MNYIVAYVCFGIIAVLIIILHQFFINHDDITVKDIILCIICTLIWPFILIVHICQLIDNNKNIVIFKAKMK